MNGAPPTASPDFTEAERRYRAQIVQRCNHLDFSSVILHDAHQALADFLNAPSASKIVFGRT
jgi:selenocysteine lyase/cysteine desulfurase